MLWRSTPQLAPFPKPRWALAAWRDSRPGAFGGFPPRASLRGAGSARGHQTRRRWSHPSEGFGASFQVRFASCASVEEASTVGNHASSHFLQTFHKHAEILLPPAKLLPGLQGFRKIQPTSCFKPTSLETLKTTQLQSQSSSATKHERSTPGVLDFPGTAESLQDADGSLCLGWKQH